MITQNLTYRKGHFKIPSDTVVVTFALSMNLEFSLLMS
jgi:hypothetical protein